MPIRTQPPTSGTMVPFITVSDFDEKHEDSATPHPQRCNQCQARGDWSGGVECEAKERCHRFRLNRLVLPALAVLLTASLLFALSCIYDVSDILSWTTDGFARRDVGHTTSDGGTFVNNKLYLIVIFVGLLLVIILGIMLSAWCCRGAFNQPLCCPCYLCACCGGLACLECIGCGLCAEGAEQF